MTTKLVADDADALVVDGVCALEDYLNEHQRACDKLKQLLELTAIDCVLLNMQGFLKLAMARRNLPAYALSDLSYHEYFDAVTVVAARSNSDGDEDEDGEDTVSDVHWKLTSPHSESLQTEDTKRSSSTLTQRKRKSSTDGSEDTDEADPAKLQQQQLDLQNSTIMWFSSLPPSDLRQAQKNFRSGKNANMAATISMRKSDTHTAFVV